MSLQSLIGFKIRVCQTRQNRQAMKYFAFFIALTFALRTSVGRTSSLTKKRPSIYEKQLPTRPLPPTHRRHHDLPLDGNGPSNFNISTTTNWAGATIDMPRASANQTDLPAIGSVKAQWNIPRLCLREGQNTSSAGTLQTWIGVSGKACEPKGAMVQAGIRAVVRYFSVFFSCLRALAFPGFAVT